MDTKWVTSELAWTSHPESGVGLPYLSLVFVVIRPLPSPTQHPCPLPGSGEGPPLPSPSPSPPMASPSSSSVTFWAWWSFCVVVSLLFCLPVPSRMHCLCPIAPQPVFSLFLMPSLPHLAASPGHLPPSWVPGKSDGLGIRRSWFQISNLLCDS